MTSEPSAFLAVSFFRLASVMQSARRSGLQRDVLALYRRALRMTRTKPSEMRPKFLLFVRYNFHQNAVKVTPRNVSAIEHMIRVGTRQLETFEGPSVKDCWVSKEMLEWEATWKGTTDSKL